MPGWTEGKVGCDDGIPVCEGIPICGEDMPGCATGLGRDGKGLAAGELPGGPPGATPGGAPDEAG